VSSWHLVWEAYEPRQEKLREALCTLGNGYFATRGAAPDAEAGDVHYPGTYLAGGYDRATTRIHGRDVENEDLVNLPNWLPLRVQPEAGREWSVDDVEILDYRQDLDLREGVLSRRLRFRDGDGRTTRWSEQRLVSMADPHLAALRVEIAPEDWAGRVRIRSALDGAVINDGVARYRELESRHLDVLTAERIGEDLVLLRSRTRQSRLEVAQVARTRSDRDAAVERSTENRVGWIGEQLEAEVSADHPLGVEKVVALHTSRDVAISEPALEARDAAARAGGFDTLREAHRRAWRHLWDEMDLDLEAAGGEDERVLRRLRTHLFHLLQTVSPHSLDLDAGVPARGWHGEAYRGHVFWDELFILPLLDVRVPSLTRGVLRYRYRRLPEARRAARGAGYRGAMFPWQSGSNGREESQKLHLNPDSGRWIPDVSHRQRHIGAAIAYNVWHYVQATDDLEYLSLEGAELFLEIARFWASAAVWSEESGRYEIRGVMGPDEYHTAHPEADPEEAGGLDNNAYTNVMASWVLLRAPDMLALLPEAERRRLCEAMGLSREEMTGWDEIGRKLRLCFHGDGILSQFEGYGELEELDWKRYQEKYGDIQRLDRILEAEGDTPNRFKASKQADVLMLFYLFSADELEQLFERLGYAWDRDLIPRNIRYYLARTSHGSTLSWVTHAWVMARSDRGASWQLFCDALDSDVCDIQGGTTEEGIHLGAMAGTVDLLHRCYTGIEVQPEGLRLDPCLPDALERLRLLVRYRRQTLEVEVTKERLVVTSRVSGTRPVPLSYRGHFRELSPGGRCEFPIVHPCEPD